MNNPLISVIIPVYNVKEYLKRCIDSVLIQTYKNMEIILVDDGSPDKCPQICDEWAKKDERIIVVHKENGGLVSARKMGISVATGEYIGYVDGDDWIESEYLEKQMIAIRETGADVVISVIFIILFIYHIKSFKRRSASARSSGVSIPMLALSVSTTRIA